MLEEEVRESSTDPASGLRTCVTACAADGVLRGPYRAVILDVPPKVVLGAHQFGRRDGSWTTHLHDDRGPVLESVSYMRGPRHGPYTTFHPDGTPHISGVYDRERRHGKWLIRSPDGIVLSEQNYVRGTLVGTQIQRHPNGQQASTQSFDEAGKPHGTWCSWLPAGTELGCTQFVDGTGIGREFAADGRLRREVRYEDGELHGTEVVIEDGRRIEVPWERGSQTGVRRVVVDGCVSEEKTVDNGEANGPYALRDCDSQVVLKSGQFCGGHFCGLWVHRNADGKVERVVEYDPLSMKLAEAEFENGRLVDFWTMQEQLRMERAACYQALAGGLCCDVTRQYHVSADCLADAPSAPETTEL